MPLNVVALGDSHSKVVDSLIKLKYDLSKFYLECTSSI